MTTSRCIGVLALQGAFREHRRMLEGLGASTREVRLPAHLDGLSGLIIPGGESTTIGKLLVEWNLLAPIRALGLAGMPIWGTCAGAIVMAGSVTERGKPMEQPLLNLMHMKAVRNAFGRQRESFEADIDMTGLETPYRAVFIRAPLMEPEPEKTEVLARIGGEAVFVKQGHLLASSFHPELTDDARVHEAFLSVVERADFTANTADLEERE